MNHVPPLADHKQVDEKDPEPEKIIEPYVPPAREMRPNRGVMRGQLSPTKGPAKVPHRVTTVQPVVSQDVRVAVSQSENSHASVEQESDYAFCMICLRALPACNCDDSD
jgi:hypothetical protein